MAQRDYVGRGKSSGTRRKTTNRKKKRSSSGTSKTMIALAAAVLITFIGGLYFIAHNKSKDAVIVPNRGKNAGSGLPHKPEERWHYIKELENRQIGVQSPTEPTAGGEVNSPAQLTNEQRQLLEQMQADMRRGPTHLNEVPYNDQSKTVGAVQTRPTTQAPRNPFSQQPVQAPHQTPPATVVPPPARQTPAPAPIQPVQKSAEAGGAKTAPKEKPQRWLVQCGSFKAMDQAESVRAQLAFAGIESRITTGGGCNRVLLGPYSSRAGADKILQSVRGAGVSNCIPVAAGG
ncbi:cell division protein FtsN [Candidatus Sodalis endolongispinus]|uniref:Cell division protein FtsN n=1 Tax=Candidatus Sodalis endolongispinus TaxID=2812662 RepID=A0ABS5Y8Z1_9GAMM|nr:cell division protein FtsN [Candidatus Sodalis endolongispinus]MBT9431407.1 cell division protein FtsN [Candidatus Sodalis endolongispinus]